MINTRQANDETKQTDYSPSADKNESNDSDWIAKRSDEEPEQISAKEPKNSNALPAYMNPTTSPMVSTPSAAAAASNALPANMNPTPSPMVSTPPAAAAAAAAASNVFGAPITGHLPATVIKKVPEKVEKVPNTTSPLMGVLSGPLSVLPVAEAVKFAMSPEGYLLEKQKEAGGGPVFRARLGLECVVATDHTSGKFFLGAPSTLLDRETNKRFGPLGVQERFIGVQRPALLTNDRNGHAKTRAFTVAMMRWRAKHVQRTFDTAMDKAYADLFYKYGDDIKSLDMYHAAIRIAGEFQFQWLLECEAPSAEHLTKYGVSSVSWLQTDSWLSNTAINKIMAGQELVDPEVDEVIATGLAKVRSSPLYPGYLELAKEHDFEQKDLDRLLLYTANFNGTFATYLMLGGVMATLPMHLGDLDALREELADTKLTMDNVDSFELLDSFTWEAMRFFIRPTIIFKEAQRNFSLPAGDGKMYDVKKGELVLASLPMLHRDESVFENASQFNARRFLTNPKLKDQVFNFGFVAGNGPLEKSKFGCAAHVTRFANKMNKLLIGTLVQRVQWRLDQQPKFTEEFMGAVGPKDIGFSQFERR